MRLFPVYPPSSDVGETRSFVPATVHRERIFFAVLPSLRNESLMKELFPLWPCFKRKVSQFSSDLVHEVTLLTACDNCLCLRQAAGDGDKLDRVPSSREVWRRLASKAAAVKRLPMSVVSGRQGCWRARTWTALPW